MSDTTIISTLTGATFTDSFGDVATASGEFVTVYDPSGSIVSAPYVDVILSGVGVNPVTFFGAEVSTLASGDSELELLTGIGTTPPDNEFVYGALHENQYGGIYPVGTPSVLDISGETPTSLDSTSTVYSGPSQVTPLILASGGSITDSTVSTNSITSAGQTIDAGGNFAFSSTEYDVAALTIFENPGAFSTVLTVNNIGEGDSVTISSSDYNGPITYDTLYSGSEFYVGDDNTGQGVFIAISGTNGMALTLGTAAGDIKFNTLVNGSVVLYDVSCFVAGTNVRTPGGEVAVETLKAGDIVSLSDGRTAPISWLGRQTVSTKFADPLRILPIRIKANALGESLPAQDLLISPYHAILVNDILVQAGALVNGVSITRETDVPETFTYYHVEVADHSLILAENLAAETFIDNVDRMRFDNWDEHAALESVAMTEMAYPRAKSARQVPQSIRARLLARAQALYGIEVAAAA